MAARGGPHSHPATPPLSRMNVLFIMKHPGSARNFESVVRLLAERGHHVHLAYEGPKGGAAQNLVARLERDLMGVTAGRAPKSADLQWSALARDLRLGVDYMRYLAPRYADADKLRKRAERSAPEAVRRLAQLPLARTPAGTRLIGGALRTAERTIPAPPSAGAFVRAHEPDILLVTPLVGLGSRQADYVRSARALG